MSEAPKRVAGLGGIVLKSESAARLAFWYGDNGNMIELKEMTPCKRSFQSF